MRTVDQELLKWAQASVREIAKNDRSDLRAKYKTAVKGAPAFIQGCGLAQALAFWQSKAASADAEKFAYRKLLEHLSAVPGLRVNPESQKKFEDFVSEAEIADYVFLTTRAQASLVFLKRMVDAYLPKDLDSNA